jgi:heterokaryon incompatibility protein (HET)
METQPYTYRPLKQAAPDINPIRLLKLDPASAHDAPLCCRLVEHQDLSKCKYEALSYVWGSASDVLPILCESGTLHITRNCEAALRRLRKKTRSRTLWVDSLCINQKCDEEKSAQVNQMSEVFANARTVLVWLGTMITVAGGL